MKYGDFSPDGREFVITRPDTPRPWINYLTNGNYCALISHTGGGYSFIGGPGYDRITRSSPGEMLARDVPGRYVYVRDNDSGDYWSITWQPVKKPLESFECRHALGITRIRSTYSGIAGSVTYFVPLNDNLEIWRVRLVNNRRKRARLSIFAYQEWVLGNYLDDLQDRTHFNLFNEAYFRDNFILATKRIWRRPDAESVAVERVGVQAIDPKFIPQTLQSNQSWGKYAFISMTVPVHAFDCDKEAFLGSPGAYDRPEALERGSCSNSEGYGRDSVGVLQHIVELDPGEDRVFDVVVGVALSEFDVTGIVARLTEPEEIPSKLIKLRRHWDSYIEKLRVNTPDQDFDLAFNIWNKYQCSVTGHWSRMASYYVAGSSVVGYRDKCFDLLGVLPINKPLSRTILTALLQHQYDDGSCLHYWEPRSDTGAYTGHSDDPLWLVYAVVAYLKETGDLDLLDDTVKFYFGRSRTTIYEHITKALDYSLALLSGRNLSLIGAGDWNDYVDQLGQEGRGESVFTSMLLAWALREVYRLADLRADRRRATTYHRRYQEIRKALNELAWDGGWYIRGFDDNGNAVGSSNNSEGQMYLDVQCWAILSGIAPHDRAEKCINSIRNNLNTEAGPLFLNPAYSSPVKSIGTVTRFAPGFASNGAALTVPSSWAVAAGCLLGHGDWAYDIYKRSLFLNRADDQDRYKAEPYVHADYACGPASTQFGRGEFSWTTGGAPWMWRAALDYILGVRPDFMGLLIDPCIPPSWKEVHVVRPFRNSIYDISITNPDGVSKGVRKIQVNGKSVEPGSVLKDLPSGRRHGVVVEMGK